MPKRSLSDLVLDTIDIISARKNRPNLLRIYRHLNRVYDLSLQTTEQLIQTLLSEGKVIRVTYKGHISYRNALTWKKYSYYLKKNMGSELPGSLLMKAISELVVGEPDYLNIGVPYNILEDHLLSMQDTINKETVQKLLHRELELESLCQYENGNIFIAPKSPESNYSSFNVDNDQNYKVISQSSLLDSSHNVINIKESSSYSNQNQGCSSGNLKKERKVYTHYRLANNNYNMIDGCLAMENVLPCNENERPRESQESSKSNKPPNCVVTPSSNQKLQLVIGRPPNCTEMTDKKNNSSEQGSSLNLLKNISSNGMKLNKSLSIGNTGSSSPAQLVNDSDSLDSSSISNSVNVNKIVGLNCEPKTENSTSGSIDEPNSCGTPVKDECSVGSSISEPNSSDTTVKDDGSNDTGKGVPDLPSSLVLERAKRKKKKKYDSSDYYFPSLKRKSRENDCERKDEKPKKIKKKDNCSGAYTKRVLFPGNTSMCCECRCYDSKFKSDTMIGCATCSNKGHQSCAVKIMNGKNWNCVDCRLDTKICIICDKRDKGLLYMCNICGDHYHRACHNPVIKLPFTAPWQCFNCTTIDGMDKQKVIENDHKTLVEEKPVEKKLRVYERTVVKKLNVNERPAEKKIGIDEKQALKKEGACEFFEDEPPDPSSWTTEDVYNYFKKYFDEEIAKNLYEQEINGRVLKLLNRDDVLNLSFKLGVGLKVLMHVKRLQLNTNNLHELWKS